MHLVFAVVLLRVAQNPVAQSTDVSERGVALVSQLLQSQHRSVAAVRERSLQQLEDLHRGKQATCSYGSLAGPQSEPEAYI